MELAAGTTLQNGKYRIEQEIGSGGFGITYLAKQTTVGGKTLRVVLKEYLPIDLVQGRQGISTPWYLRLFRRDQSVSTLILKRGRKYAEYFQDGLNKFVREGEILREHLPSSRDIVSVYDIFEENGTAYLGMEYLPGGSLDEEIKKHPGPFSEARLTAIMDSLGNYIFE